MITTDTRMARRRPALLGRTSARKRGPKAIIPEEPVSRLRVDDREGVAAPALYRLMAWLSPAYPVGAFSYSSGLEWAVEAGDVTTANTLSQWLTILLSDGAGFCDAVLFAHAYRACATSNDNVLCEVAELAAALAPSRERFLETTAQGRAFFDTTQLAWPCPAFDHFGKIHSGPVAYPIAVAVAAAGHELPLEQSLSAYLQALTANWVSAGIRLIPLGQTDGQRVIVALEPAVIATVKRALAAAIEDAGGAVFRADIAAMRHEAQYTRLFRS
jgi:urease accessory protein